MLCWCLLATFIIWLTINVIATVYLVCQWFAHPVPFGLGNELGPVLGPFVVEQSCAGVTLAIGSSVSSLILTLAVFAYGVYCERSVGYDLERLPVLRGYDACK